MAEDRKDGPPRAVAIVLDEPLLVVQLCHEEGLEEQQLEVETLKEHGRTRMSEITSRRLKKNKEVYKSLETIITAIEVDGGYAGAEQQFKQISLEADK